MKAKIKALRDELEQQIKGEDVHIGSLDIITRLDEILEEEESVYDSNVFPFIETRNLLVNVSQLISGWKGTTPQNEWSEWDEGVLNELHSVQDKIENTLKLK